MKKRYESETDLDLKGVDNLQMYQTPFTPGPGELGHDIKTVYGPDLKPVQLFHNVEVGEDERPSLKPTQLFQNAPQDTENMTEKWVAYYLYNILNIVPQLNQKCLNNVLFVFVLESFIGHNHTLN